MPIEVKCQNCDRKYRLQDTMNGKKFKCKECAAVVVATPLSSSQSAPGKTGSKASRPDSKRTAEPKQPSKGTPTSKKRPATKKRAVDPSSRKAKPSPSAKKGPPAQKRRAKKKPKPQAVSDDDFLDDDEFLDDDDFGDDDVDFGFGSSYDNDDFDDGFDDYDEPRPARKKKKKASSKKKSKKQRSSGGGLPPMTFNFNRINLAMIIGGGFLLFFAIQEARLASKTDAEPVQMNLEDFLKPGGDENVYLTLSGVYPASDEYVYNEKSGKVSDAWFACLPDEPNGPPKFIVYSNDVRSEAEIHTLMERASYTGMVVNDIRSMDSEVKSMLKSRMPNINIDEAYIFEVGREPSGYAFCMLMALGALALMGGGIFWMFFLHYD